ncbi:hypothetical protein PPERSA_06824 [Pseudocohnilembus persalinus]|uniref:Transmembrane protein n=1 Tax=Pseudocohnilembus persalinus TaxID=266149 RepID=A0A0V0QSG4_PSEPJ|nr:hypothetical protein PPERSA_06824 [Pseudocohnilembus persalinus]|eukprot:KRX05190.1 hypothetical protein PPERSA_06824 [Pseudocohnilembus persalinus]
MDESRYQKPYPLSTLDYTNLTENQKQKNLNKWQPPKLELISILFILAGIYSLVVGFISKSLSQDVTELQIKYGPQCLNQIDYTQNSIECTLEFEIDQKIDKTVYFYYQMKEFNQNHKLYLESFDEDQLTDKTTKNSKDRCKQFTTNKQMEKTTSVNGKQLNADDIAIPCGIRAKFYFQDTFQLFDSEGNQIEIDESNISWEYDRKRYKNIDLDKQWVDLENDEYNFIQYE